MKTGGPPPNYYDTDNRRKKNGFPKDGRGYAWARKELCDKLREARPKSRRTDTLQAAVIKTVWDFIFRTLYPNFPPDREINRLVRTTQGVPTLIDRLAADYLAIQFPTLCAGVTPPRIRRRPSAKRAKS
jgi:hypothetical protein